MENYVIIIDNYGKVIKSDYTEKTVNELKPILNKIQEELNDCFLLFIGDADSGVCWWKEKNIWKNAVLEEFDNLNFLGTITSRPIRSNINFINIIEYLNKNKLNIPISIADEIDNLENESFNTEKTLKELLSDKFANLEFDFFENCYGFSNVEQQILDKLNEYLELIINSIETEALGAYLYNIFDSLINKMNTEDLYDFLKYNIYDFERPKIEINHGSGFDMYDLGPWTMNND